MRLLHTSDWHFGKRLHETDLLSDQEKFCDWLVSVVREERIDCLLLAGDLYDRSNPKEEVVELLDDVLHRISDGGTQIVAISGNHDSAERLHFGSRFMTKGGLHIRAERRNLQDVGTPVTIHDRDNFEAQVLPMPYLDPQRVDAGILDRRDHESVLRAAIAGQRPHLTDPRRTVVVAHAFVNGGTSSDSERALTVGGTGAVSKSIFEGFAYVALGHLHRPQILDGERLAYSGSPLPYSFSEEHSKSIRVVELAASGLSCSSIEVPVGRPVKTLTDTLEQLLHSRHYDRHRNSFVRAILTDATPQLGAMDRLRDRFPFALELEQQVFAKQSMLDVDRLEELRGRSDEAVIQEYVKEVFPTELDKHATRFVNDTVRAVLTGDQA